MNEECCDEVDNRMQGVVRRMGLIAYRIMMVLTAVRHLENVFHESSSSDETVQLICHEFGYSIAIEYLRHPALSCRIRLSDMSESDLNDSIPLRWRQAFMHEGMPFIICCLTLSQRKIMMRRF